MLVGLGRLVRTELPFSIMRILRIAVALPAYEAAAILLGQEDVGPVHRVDIGTVVGLSCRIVVPQDESLRHTLEDGWQVYPALGRCHRTRFSESVAGD